MACLQKADHGAPCGYHNQFREEHIDQEKAASRPACCAWYSPGAAGRLFPGRISESDAKPKKTEQVSDSPLMASSEHLDLAMPEATPWTFSWHSCVAFFTQPGWTCASVTWTWQVLVNWAPWPGLLFLISPWPVERMMPSWICSVAAALPFTSNLQSGGCWLRESPLHCPWPHYYSLLPTCISSTPCAGHITNPLEPHVARGLTQEKMDGPSLIASQEALALLTLTSCEYTLLGCGQGWFFQWLFPNQKLVKCELLLL